MSLGTTYNNVALALLEFGRKGDAKAYANATKYLQLAREQFEHCGLATMVQKCYFHQGLAADEAARYTAQTPTEQRELWAKATDYYEQSAAVVETMRQQATVAEGQARAEDLTFFGSDKQVFLEAALRCHLHFRRDGVTALRWLERMKGQALLDGLLRRAEDRTVLEKADQLVDYPTPLTGRRRRADGTADGARFLFLCRGPYLRHWATRGLGGAAA